VWFGVVWFDRDVSRLTFIEGKKNAVAFGVVAVFPENLSV
jgi:hypothetical protein